MLSPCVPSPTLGFQLLSAGWHSQAGQGCKPAPALDASVQGSAQMGQGERHKVSHGRYLDLPAAPWGRGPGNC